MVSAGQNALHFSSGTFGLLGKLPNGKFQSRSPPSTNWVLRIHIQDRRREDHGICEGDPQFFADCGIELKGNRNSNMYRLTPSGTLMPCWLALKETTVFPSRKERLRGRMLIVNFAGYLDFNTDFLAEGLEKMGVSVSRIADVKLPDVEHLRQNPTEMRSVNIARVMDREENWKQFAKEVADLLQGEEYVVIPEVFGLADPMVCEWLREMIPAEILFAGTMPPSVPGIRMQMLLKRAFVYAGGLSSWGTKCLPRSIRRQGAQCAYSESGRHRR